MPIVVDASIALSWFFAADQESAVDALWDEAIAGGIAVPSIWGYEIANRLGRAVAARETTATEVTTFLAAIGSISTEVHQPSSLALVDRMIDTGLTAYDAAYLEVAASRGIPIATSDRRLREAAAAAGVAVLPG